jgi:hypothetical protein
VTEIEKLKANISEAKAVVSGARAKKEAIL